MRRLHWKLCTWTACALVGSTPVLAQEPSSEKKDSAPRETVEEITVTGSYIKRTDTKGPQAVEVVDRADLEALGVQSPIDVLDKLTVNAGSEFRSDAFKAGGQYGTANVNLRGLGLGTTLVLVDGRRQVLSGVVSNDGASFVDINNIPLQMIERVEILKEGAAATYGSDAVAGVVNFITRRNFEGFELSTNFQTTSSDGQREQGIGGIYGWANENTGFQIFGNYFNANELESEDRSFTQALRDQNGRFLPTAPFGNSTLGNPGALVPLAAVSAANSPTGMAIAAGTTVQDPLCEQAGGRKVANGRCAFEFADNFNLAENEQRAKYGATFRHDFGESLSMAVKWNYAFNRIDDVAASPSFPPSTQFFVPSDNPGNFLQTNSLFIGRPLAENSPTQRGFYDYRTNRYEVGLTGDIGTTWSWDANLSYGRSKRNSSQADTFRSGFALALDGFGGSDCQFRPSDARIRDNLRGNVDPLDIAGRTADDSQRGQGNCQFFVPGGVSFTNPALANGENVTDNFTGRLKEQTTTGLWVADAVFSGSLFTLPAGPVSLAVGTQFRRETYDVSRNKESTRTNSFIFLAGGTEFNSDRKTIAAFSEVSIPVLDTLELQAAVRFEDYSDKIGSSVDPKLAFRWQPSEWLGVRGSFSTTFRAPTLNQQRSERTENELIRDVFNTGFLPIDNRGNTLLAPEEADVYNFGIQLDPTERFNLTLDYFRIDFSDLVVAENAQALVAAENADNGTALAGKCTTVGFRGNPQITRDPQFMNAAGVCAISRIEARFVNQSSVITDGIDLGITYDLEVPGLDAFRLSTNWTHLIQYDIQNDAGTIKGAGQRNESNFARALPKFRGNVGFNAQLGAHSGGMTVRYTSSYDDDDRVPGSGFGKRIDDHTTVDAFYAYDLSRFDATLQVGVFDLFDREPPFVNTDFNFDSRTADARGRRIYANLTVRY